MSLDTALSTASPVIDNERRPIKALDGIRGIAVLLVLLSHASNAGLHLHPFLNFGGAGRYGVFLFFILSSFLLTTQFLNDDNKIGDWRFYFEYCLKRFFRIYPLYAICLFCNFALVQAGVASFDFNFKTLVQHLVFLRAQGVFWTILVECKYYFFLPFVSVGLIFLESKIRPSLGLVILIGLCTILLLRVVFPPFDSAALSQYLTIFVAGSFSALVHKKLQRLTFSKRRKLIFEIAAFAMFGISIVLVPHFASFILLQEIPQRAFHGLFLTFALLWVIFCLGTLNGTGYMAKYVENGFLRLWGRVSFSAYLWHMLILGLLIRYANLRGTIGWMVFFAATLLFSALTFFTIEQRFLKLCQRIIIFARGRLKRRSEKQRPGAFC